MWGFDGQVAEWSIATDCKSVVLWTSGVRIPPCPPNKNPRGGKNESEASQKTGRFFERGSGIFLPE
jgi:hypothetical protein